MSYQKILGEGVIIKLDEWGESGRILKILTREGVKSLVATGVRELKSKMRSEIDTLTKVEFEYVEGKEVARMVGIFPKEKLLNLNDRFVLENLVQIRNAVSNVTNFVLRTVVGETENNGLYESYLEGLQVLQDPGPFGHDPFRFGLRPQHLPQGKDASAISASSANFLNERFEERESKRILTYNSKLTEIAKENRKNMTKQEVVFWEKVHKDKTGFDFTRQKPIGNFIIDFYCDELMLALEVDGAFHSEEGHKERDEERTRYLNGLGIKVVRFTNNEVVEPGFNSEYLKKIFQERKTELLDVLVHSHPSLGEGAEAAGRSGRGLHDKKIFSSLEIIWLIKILISLGYWEEGKCDKYTEENLKYVAENKKEVIEQINKSIESSHM